MRTPSPIVPINAARGQSAAKARAHRRMRDVAAAASAAAQLSGAEPPRSGRAWLNGQELGGYDRRYGYLTRAYE